MLATRRSARPSTLTIYRAYSRPRTKPTSNAVKAPPTGAVPSAAPGSTHHHDLASFLHHASTSGLSPRSTVYVGTHYEYTSITALRPFGFTLTRTGRSSDLGIDLVGHWAVPSVPVPLRAILQCKARSRKLAPENVRELEGAFVGAPAGWRGADVLGFLVAGEAATKGVREALVRSTLPLGFMQICREGVVRQVLWNHVAGEMGLEGMGVTLRHSVGEGDEKSDGDAAAASEVVLTYKGRAWTAKEHRKRGRPRKVAMHSGLEVKDVSRAKEE